MVDAQQFRYGVVFGPIDTQAQVYERTVEPLLRSALEGYNVALLAYGTTGSGKTYTIGSNGTQVLLVFSCRADLLTSPRSPSLQRNVLHGGRG
jgi:hypothetical protein